MFLMQATVVHDTSTIDLLSVSAANCLTIADPAMTQFHKKVGGPLRAAAALKEAAKQ